MPRASGSRIIGSPYEGVFPECPGSESGQGLGSRLVVDPGSPDRMAGLFQKFGGRISREKRARASGSWKISRASSSWKISRITMC